MRLEQLTLQLNENQSNKPKAKIKINDLQACVENENDCLKVKGKLASLILLDVSSSKGLYSDRFMTCGDKAAEFEFLKYQGCPLLINELKNDFEACLKLRTSSFKYVHSQQFIAWLSNYFQQFNQLQDALGKMRALASGLRDLSFQTQRSSRVKLNIKGEAPILIIPQNRRSKEALVFNLGKIEVRNRFARSGSGRRDDARPCERNNQTAETSGEQQEEGTGVDEAPQSCLIDYIDVKFTDAHLYSAHLCEYPNDWLKLQTESEILSKLKHDDYGTVRLLSCFFRFAPILFIHFRFFFFNFY